MRFAYAESLTDPSFYAPLAKAAEEAGYHSVTIPDSIAFPRDSDSKYPYNGTGDRNFLEDKPFIDPFVQAATMAAVTTTLKFATFVVKLPIRHPVLVAKQLASIAVISNDRFEFGIGSSPWPEDFTITGTDWETRGKRMDEMIDVLRGLTGPGFFEYSGKHYQIPAIKMAPTPKKPIPLLIGGHTDPALKRAVRNDGWMFAGGNGEELDRCLVRLRELRAEAGKADAPFTIYASSMDGFTLDGVKRLEEKGVTDLVVGFRNAYAQEHDVQPLEVKIGAIRKYADKIISKL